MLFLKENLEASKTVCLQIFREVFGDEIEYMKSSENLGPMGQFVMDFRYLPDDTLVRLETDRGRFVIRLEDREKDWVYLGQMEEYECSVTEACIRKAVCLTVHHLKEKDFCFYRSRNGRLYRKEQGKYYRIRN